jgi:hypothetical protein
MIHNLVVEFITLLKYADQPVKNALPFPISQYRFNKFSKRRIKFNHSIYSLLVVKEQGTKCIINPNNDFP